MPRRDRHSTAVALAREILRDSAALITALGGGEINESRALGLDIRDTLAALMATLGTASAIDEARWMAEVDRATSNLRKRS